MLRRVKLRDLLMYLRGNSIGTDDGRQTTDVRQHTLDLSKGYKPIEALPGRDYVLTRIVIQII